VTTERFEVELAASAKAIRRHAKRLEHALGVYERLKEQWRQSGKLQICPEHQMPMRVTVWCPSCRGAAGGRAKKHRRSAAS
jgi:hypothetical protein